MVALSGPPPVNRNGSVKSWNVPISCSSIMIRMIPRICGSVTCQTRDQIPAPSSSAASYSSVRTPVSAAR